MDLTILSDPRLYELLSSIDQELAESVRRGGCPCGGRLHRGDYPRKPRGALTDPGREYDRRRSWCCAVCRQRRTPPSVRFLGRRVYLGVVVVLVSALAEGITARRASWLREQVAVSRRTLERWRSWWRARFVVTEFWRQARSRLQAPVDAGRLPGSLLERFEGPGEARDPLVLFLRFLSPLTTATA